MNLAATAVNFPVKIFEFSADSERLCIRVSDLDAEKALGTERISKLVAASEVKSTVVTELNADKVASKAKVENFTANLMSRHMILVVFGMRNRRFRFVQRYWKVPSRRRISCWRLPI